VFVPSALGAGGGRRANCEGGGVPESSSHLLSQRGHERIQARPGGAAIDWRVQTTGPRPVWATHAKIFECTACPKVGATVIARCWGVSAAGSWRVSTLVNEQCVGPALASRGLRRGLFAGLKMMPRLRLTAERSAGTRLALVKGVLNEAGGDAKQPGGCQSQNQMASLVPGSPAPRSRHGARCVVIDGPAQRVDPTPKTASCPKTWAKRLPTATKGCPSGQQRTCYGAIAP
jgi:hypothetical protein